MVNGGLAGGRAGCLPGILAWGILIIGSSHLRGMCGIPEGHHSWCYICSIGASRRDPTKSPAELKREYLDREFPGLEIACCGGLCLGKYPAGISNISQFNGEKVVELLSSKVRAGSTNMRLNITVRTLVGESSHEVVVVLAGSNDLINLIPGRVTNTAIAEWIKSHLKSIVAISNCRHLVLSSILPRLEDNVRARAERKDGINQELLEMVRQMPLLPNRERKGCKVHFLDFRETLPSWRLGVEHRCPHKGDRVHLRGTVMESWLSQLKAMVDGIKAEGQSPDLRHRRRGGRRAKNKK